ncbi:unnamed protein product [Calicophoron daubneyi]|uniref:Beta-dystroglycan n=1 Tax=Calicophoron daubneyi TaxID=300641 RepID=A0AAV2TK12_CALDB
MRCWLTLRSLTIYTVLLLYNTNVLLVTGFPLKNSTETSYEKSAHIQKEQYNFKPPKDSVRTEIDFDETKKEKPSDNHLIKQPNNTASVNVKHQHSNTVTILSPTSYHSYDTLSEVSDDNTIFSEEANPYSVTHSPITFITELLPENTENLQPGQWIYIRVCTTPVGKPKQNYQSLEELIRNELRFQSCSSLETKRPRFDAGQSLVVSISGSVVAQYSINDRSIDFLDKSVERERIRFWSHRSQGVLLIGLHPTMEMDGQLVQIKTVTHIGHDFERFATTEEKQGLSPVWRWTDKLNILRKLGNSAHEGEIQHTEEVNAYFDEGEMRTSRRSFRVHRNHNTVSTVYLDRFRIRFAQEKPKVVLRCNKTGPVIIYDPFFSGVSNKRRQLVASHIKPTHNVTQKTSTSATIDPEPNSRSEQIQKVYSSVSSSSSSLSAETAGAPSADFPLAVVNVESPQPVLISETMDEWAIYGVQSRLQPPDFQSNDIVTIQPTSDSLLVPTEPTMRTLTLVVPKGERLMMTCEGSIDYGKLTLLYDNDVWTEISKDASLISIDAEEMRITLILEASSITWKNVTTDVAEGYGLRSVDQITNVKCGFYRPTQLSTPLDESIVVSHSPVEHIYFSIVSKEDFKVIQNALDEERRNTFDYGLPLQPPRIAATLIYTIPSDTDPKSNTIGFWNLSLSHLSGMKLAVSIILVIVIVSLILLTIRNCAKTRVTSSRLSSVQFRENMREDGDTSTGTHRKQNAILSDGSLGPVQDTVNLAPSTSQLRGTGHDPSGLTENASNRQKDGASPSAS